MRVPQRGQMRAPWPSTIPTSLALSAASPAAEHLRDAPRLSDAAPRGVRGLGIEDLAHGAHTRVAQVIRETLDQANATRDAKFEELRAVVKQTNSDEGMPGFYWLRSPRFPPATREFAEWTVLNSDFKENFDVTVTALLEVMRTERNDSGHPTGKRVSRDDCSAMFGSAARLFIPRLYQLRDACKGTPTPAPTQ